jgi:hypothetical protein
MKRFVLLMLFIALVGSADAQKRCGAISDQRARLECYDDGNRAAAPPSPAKTISREGAIRTPEMSDYVVKIDKAFLENGINISVSAVTTGQTGSLASYNVPYPALTFFGYIDRATAYAISTKILNSFAEARSLGFATVEFQDKAGGNGRYIFDLRKPSPSCSRDLCF